MMASGFPASIDNFTDPLSNSPLNSPSHSALHSDVNDAIEKIETNMGLIKVGTFSNSNTTSLDITGIGATYDFYRLVGFLPVGSAPLTFQLYDGATARNSAAYYTAGFRIAAIIGTLNAVTNNGSTSATIFAGNLVANASFQMDFRYGGAGAYSSWSHFGTNIGNGETEHRSGAYHLNATADRIKLSSASNFSATVVLYGYRK